MSTCKHCKWWRVSIEETQPQDYGQCMYDPPVVFCHYDDKNGDAALIYEVDPLLCPECGGDMRIIAFIEEEVVIRKILAHLKLWEDQQPRPPPVVPEQVDIQYVPFFDS